MLYPDELRAHGRQVGALRTTQTATLNQMDKPTGKSLVGVEGFEPPTSSSQSWRATRLRYTPRTKHRRPSARKGIIRRGAEAVKRTADRY